MLPVTFGALDGQASWRDEEGRDVGPHRLAAAYPEETTRPALFTALRTGFAEALLREAFLAIRGIRSDCRRERGLAADASARGLGKLLVVAPDQATARRYHSLVQSWLPAGQAAAAQLATSDAPRAHAILAAFRLRPEPSILVTVAMAYEGLDAPEVAVVAALTHIRSRPWLEQMVARATRVDPHAGAYGTQRAVVFHPDDPLTGNKSRAEMTLAELEAALGWLERNRLADQLHVLDGDPRYAWTARKRGAWNPPRRSSGSRTLRQARQLDGAARLTLSIPLLLDSASAGHEWSASAIRRRR